MTCVTIIFLAVCTYLIEPQPYKFNEKINYFNRPFETGLSLSSSKPLEPTFATLSNNSTKNIVILSGFRNGKIKIQVL